MISNYNRQFDIVHLQILCHIHLLDVTVPDSAFSAICLELSSWTCLLMHFDQSFQVAFKNSPI